MVGREGRVKRVRGREKGEREKEREREGERKKKWRRSAFAPPEQAMRALHHLMSQPVTASEKGKFWIPFVVCWLPFSLLEEAHLKHDEQRRG